MTPLPPIPTPLQQRLRELRLRWLPLLIVVLCAATIAVLWRENISAPQMIGQAEPVLANLSSHKPGTIALLNVVRFQKVRAGDVLGQVLVADPKYVAASLAEVRAELDQFRAGLSPVIQQQRAAVDYVQLRISWMKERAELAGIRANLDLAELELSRTQAMFQAKIASQSELDFARTTREALKKQGDELAGLVAEGEKGFKNVAPNPDQDPGKVSNDAFRTALAVQEARLQQMELEFAPVPLRAPLDGIITSVLHRSGESVVAGEPVLAIASETPVRIIGYLRPPNLDVAKVGMKVRVRVRNGLREAGLAQVTELGTQLETPPLALALPLNPGADLALPVEISVPSNLKIRPGELVDLSLVAD